MIYLAVTFISITIIVLSIFFYKNNEKIIFYKSLPSAPTFPVLGNVLEIYTPASKNKNSIQIYFKVYIDRISQFSDDMVNKVSRTFRGTCGPF